MIDKSLTIGYYSNHEIKGKDPKEEDYYERI